jgi:hypothetical protein
MRETGDDAEFTYEIMDTEHHGDDSATVKVSITETDGKAETRELPVVRVDGTWKIGLRDDGSVAEPNEPVNTADETP